MPVRDKPLTTAGLSIRDAVMAQQSPRTTCRVCMFVRRQPEGDAAQWVELLVEDPQVVQHASIAAVMAERCPGMSPPMAMVTAEQVSRHRRERHDSLTA